MEDPAVKAEPPSQAPEIQKEGHPASTAPLTELRLKQIASDACNSALEKADSYNHSMTAQWNDVIITKILQSLISETSTPNKMPDFKYAVNSTIIQHLTDPRPQGAASAGAAGGAAANKVGRRGMHSATGAYWNNQKDGMWSYKYEGGEQKGLDVVVSILWIGV